LEIKHRVNETDSVFFEESDRGVARIAEKATHFTALVIVIVIDTQMVEKNLLIRRVFSRNTRMPILFANSTATVLPI
jgi:Cdc6-like AAA superfamily ATPase